MNNALPTGMFIPGKSLIYRMDSRAKLITFITIIVAVVFTDTIPGYMLMLLLCVAVIMISGLNFSSTVNPVKRAFPFFLIISIMNTCFNSPNHAWIKLWIFAPSYVGLMQGINVTARLIIVLIMSNVLTMTTAPMELTEAVKAFLSPLRYIKIPADHIALIISVSIQFIPILFEETDMIRKAQTARGARFDSKKISEKAADALPLVVPVFISAFRRADELSMAMEARGYRINSKRTVKKRNKIKATDWAAMAISLSVCLVQALILNQ